MTTKLNITLGALVAILASHASLLAQGSLTPPGPPGPTMKTLDQIDAKLEKRTPISSLPFLISQPGSYYLTQNLVMTGSGNGISVDADDVTIDLNGFRLDGANLGTTGITVQSPREGTSVRNGRLIGWTDYAVFCQNRATVDGVDVSSGNGISVGNEGRVTSCRVTTTGTQPGINAVGGVLIASCVVTITNSAAQSGIRTMSDPTIERCTVYGNYSAPRGIFVSGGGMIRDVSVYAFATGIESSAPLGGAALAVERSRVRQCQTGISMFNGSVAGCFIDSGFGTPASGDAISVSGIGIITDTICRRHARGIFLGAKARVTGCTAEGNAAAGIEVGADSAVSQSHSHGNGLWGIAAGDRAVLTGCQTNLNGAGILAGATASITQCQAAENGAAGISAGASASVLDCQTTLNGNDGIQVGDGARVSNCTSRKNLDDGIQITGGAHITGCTSDGNAWGIYGTASYSRIEGNNIIFNSNTGLQITAGGNTVLRNSFRGNPTAINAPGSDVAPLQSAATMTNPVANIAF